MLVIAITQVMGPAFFDSKLLIGGIVFYFSPPQFFVF